MWEIVERVDKREVGGKKEEEEEGGDCFLTSNGRISMAGLNTKNVKYFAKAVHEVVTGSHAA